MQTIPIDNILPIGQREDEPELAAILDKFASALRESVYFGTHVFDACRKEIAGRKDDVAPFTMLFRHFLEVFDALPFLVRNSVLPPCQVLMRTLLEIYVYSKYLLEDDQERRAYSFMVWHTHQRVNGHQQIDPATQRGKQLIADLSKDELFCSLVDSDFPGFDSRAVCERLQSVLAKPGFSEAEMEYQRLVNSGKRNPNWYSLYGGPASIEQLARRVGCSGLYAVYYRGWSSITHATDILSGKVRGADDGNVFMLSLRNPRDAQTVTSVALNLSLFFYRLHTTHVAPGFEENFAQWYDTKIKSIHDRLLSDTPIITVAD